MFGLGIPELVVILVVALVIFGPSKLPELGSGLGQGLKDFRKAFESPDEPETDKTKIEDEKRDDA